MRTKNPALTRRAWGTTNVKSSPILRPAPAPSKPAPELAKCPHCDYGRCAPGTHCCKPCLDAHRQSEEARARKCQRGLIGRFAARNSCRPDELKAALLAELAEGIAEIIGAALDEREAAA